MKEDKESAHGLKAWKQKVETIAQKTGLVARKSLELLARPEGFEPPTPRSVVWCSVQLSYGRASMAKKTGGESDLNPRCPLAYTRSAIQAIR
jgi:hypothetical protein